MTPIESTSVHLLLREVARVGWATVATSYKDERSLGKAALDVARSFGTVRIAGRSRELVEKVIPRPKEVAHKASLSAKFGLGPFPYHTDTAHWVIPGRYLVLACIDPGRDRTFTSVVDRAAIQMSATELAEAQSAVFFVRNGRHSFYSEIFPSDRSFVRFDVGCMEPTDELSSRVMRVLCNRELQPVAHKIEWDSGMITVLDNWRLLHSRSGVSATDTTRTLLRVLVQ